MDSAEEIDYEGPLPCFAADVSDDNLEVAASKDQEEPDLFMPCELQRLFAFMQVWFCKNLASQNICEATGFGESII